MFVLATAAAATAAVAILSLFHFLLLATSAAVSPFDFVQHICGVQLR